MPGLMGGGVIMGQRGPPCQCGKGIRSTHWHFGVLRIAGITSGSIRWVVVVVVVVIVVVVGDRRGGA